MVLKLGHFSKQVRNILKIFKMCCWRRGEKISGTDLMRIGSIKGVEEERNILHKED